MKDAAETRTKTAAKRIEICSRARGLIVGITFWLIGCGLVSHAYGQAKQKADFSPAEIEELLKTGRYSLLTLEEFQQLDIQPKPKDSVRSLIRTARYSATIDDGKLRGTFSVDLTPNQLPTVISLAPFGPHLDELTWADDQPATIGNGADSALSLFADRAQSLIGKWSATGRRQGVETVFDLKFLPATSNSLALRLPAEFEVVSNDQIFQKPIGGKERADNSAASQIEWTLYPGNDFRSTLRIRKRKSESGGALFILDQRSDVQVDRDSTAVTAEFLLRAHRSSVSEVWFAIPQNLTIDSVRYADEPAQFDRVAETMPVGNAGELSKTSQRSILRVRLPEPLIGISRKLTFRAVQQTVTDTDADIPYFELLSQNERPVVLQKGETTLQIQSPLSLEAIQTSGFRQSDAVYLSSGGSTLVYAQSSPAARIRARLREPQPQLNLEFADTIYPGRDAELTSWILVSSTEQPCYELRFEINTEWDVTEVRRSLQSLPVNSRIERTEDNRRILVVNFPTPVQVASPRILSISARRPDVAADSVLRLPILRLDGTGSCRRTTRVVHTDGDLPELELAGFSRTTVDELSAFASSIYSSTPDERSVSYLTASDRSASATLELSNENRSRATIHNLAVLTATELRERIDVDFQSDQPIDKLTLQVSDPDWKPVFLFQNQEVPVSISEPGVVQMNLPIKSDRIALQAQRRRSREDGMRVLIVTSPDCETVNGDVRLTTNIGRLRTSADDSIVADEAFSTDPADKLFRYTNAGGQLRILNEAERVPQAQLRLTSTYNSEEQADDAHNAEWIVTGSAAPFRFRMQPGTSLRSAAVNGQVMQPRAGGEDLPFVLPLESGVEVNRIRLRYHVAQSTDFLPFEVRRDPLLPETNVNATGLRWTVQAGEGLVPAQDVGSQSEWAAIFERFFGPFAALVLDSRPVQEPVRQTFSTIPQRLSVRFFNVRNVQGLMWAVFLLSLVVCSLLRTRFSRRVTMFLLAVIIVAVIAWPDARLKIASSAFVGWLLGCCLPASLFRLPRREKTTETTGPASKQFAATTAGIFFLLFLVPRATSAQDEQLPEFIRPAQLPVVYVRKDLLQSTVLPQWPDRILLSEANCDLKVDQQHSAVATMRLTLVRHAKADAQSVELPVPFADANPAWCELDGQRVSFRREAGLIVVDLLADSSEKQTGAEKKNLPADVAAKTALRTHELVFELHPRSEIRPGEQRRIELPLLSCFRSRLRASFADAKQQVQFQCDNRPIVFGRGGQFSINAAGAKTCSVIWSNADNSDTDVSPQCSVECVVVAHSTFLDVFFREVISGWTGQQPLLWKIPDQADLEFASADGLVFETNGSQETTITGDQNAARATWMLRRDEQDVTANSSSVELRGQFRLPVRGKRILPALKFHPAAAGPECVAYQIALAAAPGFEIGAVNSPEFQQVPAESLETGLIDEAGVTQPLVFAANRPSELSAELNPRVSRQYVTIRQSGRTYVEETLWDFSVEIDTDRSLPVFSHEIEVPAALEVTDVELQSGQASRMGRWFRTGNILRVYLNGPTADARQIRIRGRVRHVSGEAEVPLLALPRTLSQPTVIQLSHTAETRVTYSGLLPVNRPQEFPDDQFPAAEEADEISLGQFLLRAEQPCRVKVVPRERVRVQQDVIVRRDPSSGRLTLNAILTCSDNEGFGQRITCRFPDTMPAASHTVEGCRIVDQQGSTLTLLPDEDVTVFRLSSLVETDETSVLQNLLELPEVTGHVESQPTRLLLQDEFEPDVSDSSREDAQGVENELKVWQPSFPVRIRRLRETNLPTDFVFVHHGLQLSKDAANGTSILLVSGLNDSAVTLNWPADFSIQSVRCDGTPASDFEQSAKQLKIFVQSGKVPHLIAVEWSRRNEDWLLSPRTFQLPFADLNSNHTFVSLDCAAADQIRWIRGNRLARVSMNEPAIRFSQMLLDEWRRRGESYVGEVFLEMASQLETETEEPADENVQRFLSAVQELRDQLPTTVRRSADLPAFVGQNFEFHGLGNTPQHSVSCYVYPRVTERLLIALAVLPLGIWLLSRWSRSSWYQRQAAWLDGIPCSVLGVIWIFTLQPWVIGILLLLTGFGTIAQQFSQRPPSPSASV